MDNRRLKILPEVLPAPTKAPTSNDVRGRTLAHMQRLLATTAAMLPLTDCTKSDTQGSQTVTIPSASSSATSESSAHGTLLVPTATATPTAKATATAPDMGYAVIDPMPAPARCLGLANATRTSAVFVRDPGGLLLEFSATLPSGGAWAGTTFTPNGASAWSGTIVTQRITGLSAVARVKVTAGNTSAGVSFSITCAAGPGSIAITSTFTDPPTESTKVTLQKHEY